MLLETDIKTASCPSVNQSGQFLITYLQGEPMVFGEVSKPHAHVYHEVSEIFFHVIFNMKTLFNKVIHKIKKKNKEMLW